jgi:hypothetical protein
MCKLHTRLKPGVNEKHGALPRLSHFAHLATPRGLTAKPLDERLTSLVKRVYKTISRLNRRTAASKTGVMVPFKIGVIPLVITGNPCLF